MNVRFAVCAVAGGVALVGSVWAWTAAGPSDSASEPAGVERPVEDGPSLFRAKGCATCHNGPDSQSPMGSQFPPLTNAASWAGERVPGMSARDYVTMSIREPGAAISPAYTPTGGPTTGMPTLALSDGEVAALVEYLLAP